jgi:hypothetical protein
MTLRKVPKLDDVAKYVYELANGEALKISGERLERNARFVEYLRVHDEQGKYTSAKNKRMWEEPIETEMEIEEVQSDAGEPMEEDD